MRDVISHGDVHGSFVQISPGKYDRTVLGYSVGDSVGDSDGSYKGYIYGNLDDGVDCEVNFLIIYFIQLAPLKEISMENLTIHWVESVEDGTAYDKRDGLIDGISLGQ